MGYKRRKKRDSVLAAAIIQKEDEWDRNHHHIRSITGVDLDDLEYDEYGVDGHFHQNAVSSTMSPGVSSTVSMYDDEWDDLEPEPEEQHPVIRRHTKGAHSAMSIGSDGG